MGWSQGPAGPPEVPWLPRRLGWAGAGGVGVGGVGGRRAVVAWVSAGRQAEGAPDLLPAMPGLAGLADVVAGRAVGGELEVAGGASTGEGLDVADGGFGVAAEHRPGDGLCAEVPGEPERFPAHCLAGRPDALLVFTVLVSGSVMACAPFLEGASLLRPERCRC
jgi:hypothetical protein